MVAYSANPLKKLSFFPSFFLLLNSHVQGRI